MVLMDDFKDYKVFIEDLILPPQDVTKEQLIQIINKKLRKKWTDKDYKNGVEIDIQPEWKKTLAEDSSTIWDYEKVGWKVMQYRKGREPGPFREWINFKNTKYKGKKK